MAKELKIAVMAEGVQLSDIVGVDIFGNLSREYLDLATTLDPRLEAFRSFEINITWYYVATTLEQKVMTPSLKFLPNITYDDCPRDLDIVITGGNDPRDRAPSADKFIKEAWSRTRVWMTTCIGSPWIASAGVLDGHKATTNREFIPVAQEMYPNVEWLDLRWVVDEKPYSGPGKGELWTAGGAGTGIEMIANYVLQNYDNAFVQKLSLGSLSFGFKEGQNYK